MVGELVGGAAITRAHLETAWDRVRSKGGAPGVDGIDVVMFEQDVSAHLDALWGDLSSGTYRPQAYRAFYLTKPSGGKRRLVIPALRDRVVQTALANLLLPTIEPLLHPCSYAYRRGVGVHDALAKVAEYRDRGLSHVLLADIESFFESIRHEVLDQLLENAGAPAAWRQAIGQWLTAAIIEPAGAAIPALGTPLTRGLAQGLPLSPLLANLYLTPFDRAVVESGWKLVRYADDLAVCCERREEAERAAEDLNKQLEPLGLRVNPDKTRLASFEEGFEYLGARFVGRDVLPAVAHPYEADFAAPAAVSHKPAPQALPHMVLRTLYIQQQGATLGVHGGRLVVHKGERSLLDLPAHHVEQIFVFGRVQISTAAMVFCLTRNVPIYLLSGRGNYYGVLRQVRDGTYALRHAQYAVCADRDRRARFAAAVVRAKLIQYRELLAHHARNHPDTELAAYLERLSTSLERLGEPLDIDQLRGVEGAATAAYYEGYGRCFRGGGLAFAHRNRRPPIDPVNSLLSFGYTLLFHNLYSYVTGHGLDPAAGLFHEPTHGHPAIVSDIMEEFRAPIVDSLVLALANRNQLNANDFYFAAGDPQPCFLKDEARPRFLQAFENKLATMLHHPDVTHEIDWRRVLDLQVARLVRFVRGATDCYQPLTRN